MAKTLEQVIGGVAMTGVIQEVVPGLPDNLLPPGFLNLTRPVDGDKTSYQKVQGTQRTARQVYYGAPPRLRKKDSIDEVPVVLAHAYEEQMVDVTTQMNLLSEDGRRQEKGIQEVDRQTAFFKQLFTNLRVSSVYSALLKGGVWFDGNGELLPNSTGATLSIDYSIPANNQNQLNGIIDTAWDNAAAKITTQIANLRKQARKDTGYELRHALYGPKILEFLLTNTQIKELINRNAGFQAAAAAGEIPQGLLGFTWHPLHQAFFADSSDTKQSWMADDNIVFVPEPSREWYEIYEGSYPVPNDIGNVSDDAVAALSNVDAVNGMFSYGTVDKHGKISQVAGDTFLPIIKVPGNVWIADVDF